MYKQSSVVNCQSSIINYQLSIVNCQLPFLLFNLLRCQHHFDFKIHSNLEHTNEVLNS